MSAPEDPDSPEAWLWIAHADLRTAEYLLTNPSIPQIMPCYHAQQAAEKSLKAALVQLEVDFPYTHNLDTLMRFIPGEWELHDHRASITRLSEYAFTTRYPGNLIPRTTEEAHGAVADARYIIEFVELKIQFMNS